MERGIICIEPTTISPAAALCYNLCQKFRTLEALLRLYIIFPLPLKTMMIYFHGSCIASWNDLDRNSPLLMKLGIESVEISPAAYRFT